MSLQIQIFIYTTIGHMQFVISSVTEQSAFI